MTETITPTNPNNEDKHLWSVDNHTWYQCPVHISEIEKIFVAEGLKRPIEFAFVFREQMQRVNRDYRGKNYPTDTLSFPAENNQEPSVILLCPQEINAFCLIYHIPLKVRWTHLMIHAALHAHNFDHESQSDFKAMIEKEKKIFNLCPDLHNYVIQNDYSYTYKP